MKPFRRTRNATGSRLLKRLGGLAVLFFLIKGLLWLLVPLLIAFWGFLGF